jgi:hypothetical protein
MYIMYYYTSMYVRRSFVLTVKRGREKKERQRETRERQKEREQDER